jgi:DNA-3-methyladenine glycosylase
MTRITRLPRSFYNRDTNLVARELIGKYIVMNAADGRKSARIVEVEAYIGEEDPACHAACGQTIRNALMYGKPGVAYIYFIYGMYHCLNFVAERKGFPAAILLRAAEPVDGVELMHTNSSHKPVHTILSGPGKFCLAFGLTRAQNGLDLTGSTLYLENRNEHSPEIGVSRRIGIRKGTDKLWRYFDKSSNAVSGGTRHLR